LKRRRQGAIGGYVPSCLVLFAVTSFLGAFRTIILESFCGLRKFFGRSISTDTPFDKKL
jgi:hypothetical protein